MCNFYAIFAKIPGICKKNSFNLINDQCDVLCRDIIQKKHMASE